MSQYRQVRIPGGTYFFTVVTHRRRPFLTESWSQSIVSQVLHEVQARAPFVVEAWVFLPDHWHCIWTLPEGDSDYSKRWGLIKAGFSKRAQPLLEREERYPEIRSGQRTVAIWQKRFWEHVIRDEADWRLHLDYIHYNPVKHGLVEHVRAWPHSSFHRFVEQGCYEMNLG
jgi:putative transposase